MGTIRIQASLRNDSALPRDAATNTWHFETSGGDNAAAAAVAITDLTAFYHDIDGLLSSALGGDLDFKAYDLEHNSPRTPIDTETITITPGTSARYPNEVAICLSFRAALVSGLDPRRRRGRIYLGPIDSSAGDQGTGDMFIDAGAIGAIANAAQNLLDAGVSSIAKWAVFSPTNAGPEPWSIGDLGAGTDPVVAGYVDNAFDTIRSRGLIANDRSIFEL